MPLASESQKVISEKIFPFYPEKESFVDDLTLMLDHIF
jgi:hypothetical protein